MSQAKPAPKPLSKDALRKRHAYWGKSLRIVFLILGLWFFLSLGCGVLFREWLDATLPNVGGAPFGFWMAQQGAIVGFLGLLVLYMILMNRLDHQSGYEMGSEEGDQA